MVITRTWLNDWIDLDEVDKANICSTLNEIGL